MAALEGSVETIDISQPAPLIPVIILVTMVIIAISIIIGIAGDNDDAFGGAIFMIVILAIIIACSIKIGILTYQEEDIRSSDDPEIEHYDNRYGW